MLRQEISELVEKKEDVIRLQNTYALIFKVYRNMKLIFINIACSYK